MTEMIQFLAAPFVLCILLVGIHAYLGLHVLQRDVIFVDISLAQVAALGGALAMLFAHDHETSLPILIALALVLIAALVLALLRHYEKKISQEAIIGITYALASGSLILVMDHLPHGGEHLKNSLVGNILFVTWTDVLVTGAIYAVVGGLHYYFRKRFWASSKGELSSFKWDFAFYFLFGLVITFSTKHAGVLVVFSVLVVPAALATRFMDSVTSRLTFAWLFGLLATLAAFFLSLGLDLPSGATMVVTLTASFFAILLSRLVYEKIGR